MQAYFDIFYLYFNNIAYFCNTKVKYMTKHPTSAEVGCLVIWWLLT